jgi:hypothetical protein
MGFAGSNPARRTNMKIYVSHSKDIDFVNELYKPMRESELNNLHTFFLPHENQESVNAKEVLKDCDFVIAEVSVPATGQGIELGWADMIGVPILCVSKEGSEISRSLKYVTDKFLTYKDSNDLIAKISEFLSK